MQAKTRAALCFGVGVFVFQMALHASPALGVAVFMDDEAASLSGTWTLDAATANVVNFAVAGDEQYSTDLAATATWSPDVRGNYTIQAHWFADASKSAQATYTVHHALGTSQVTVDQRAFAAQAANGLGATTNVGSGWYTLGTFPMNSSSRVVLSNTAGSGELSADAMLFSNEGAIVDIASSAATFGPTPWFFPRAYASNVHNESTQYTHLWGGSDTATFDIGGDGIAHVQVSWPAHSAHSTAARYRITDGSGTQHDVIVDERFYADQATPPSPQPDWSGWYNAGFYQLGPSSTVELKEQSGAGGALGTDSLWVRHYEGYSAEVVGDGARGYWRLNEPDGWATADNSGRAVGLLDATHQRSPDGKVSGPALINEFDTSVRFNGADPVEDNRRYLSGSGLSTAAADGGNVFDGDWTIEGWFVQENQTFGAGIFSGHTVGGSTFSAPILTFDQDNPRIGIMDAGLSWSGIWLDLAPYGDPGDAWDYLGKPVYVVMTKTDDGISIYGNVDGDWMTPVENVLPSSIRPDWVINSSIDGFFIGRHYYGPGHAFDGIIDEVAIYDSALSWEQIQLHYSAAVPEPGGLLLAMFGLGICSAVRPRWRRRPNDVG